MRLDRLGPRTWLLAAAAAWALASWLLALAGLGAHVPLLAADADLLQPVPQAPAEAAPRLGPMSRYDAAVARPLFAADRRPHPFVLDAGAEGEEPRGNGFDYMLTSVLIAPPLQMATVQPAGGGEGIPVRLGESSKEFPDWRLVELQPRSAVFEGPGGRRTLPLRTYDGTGGEPPSHAPDANQRLRAHTSDAAEAAAAAAEAAAAARRGQAAEPTQVQRQAEAIRRRIEARRAQMRREADKSSAPSPESVESDP